MVLFLYWVLKAVFVLHVQQILVGVHQFINGHNIDGATVLESRVLGGSQSRRFKPQFSLVVGGGGRRRWDYYLSIILFISTLKINP